MSEMISRSCVSNLLPLKSEMAAFKEARDNPECVKTLVPASMHFNCARSMKRSMITATMSSLQPMISARPLLRSTKTCPGTCY